MNPILTFLKEAFLRCLFSHISTYIHIFLFWHFHSTQLDLTQSFPDFWLASPYSCEISTILTKRYPSFSPLLSFPLQLTKIGLTTFSNVASFCQSSSYPLSALPTLRAPTLVSGYFLVEHIYTLLGKPTLWLDLKQKDSLHFFGIRLSLMLYKLNYFCISRTILYDDRDVLDVWQWLTVWINQQFPHPEKKSYSHFYAISFRYYLVFMKYMYF